MQDSVDDLREEWKLRELFTNHLRFLIYQDIEIILYCKNIIVYIFTDYEK